MQQHKKMSPTSDDVLVEVLGGDVQFVAVRFTVSLDTVRPGSGLVLCLDQLIVLGSDLHLVVLGGF